MSDEQITTWPAPGGINEIEARTTCRDTIVNTTLIGESCVNSTGNYKSTVDIIQACVDDLQVGL